MSPFLWPIGIIVVVNVNFSQTSRTVRIIMLASTSNSHFGTIFHPIKEASSVRAPVKHKQTGSLLVRAGFRFLVKQGKENWNCLVMKHSGKIESLAHL